MTPSLEPPPDRPRRRAVTVPRLSANPDVRSIQVGILATILLHLLVILAMPEVLDLGPGARPAGTPLPPEQQFDIDLAPDAPPEAKDPFKFVEVNPDAPDNVPDNTTNFGAQNQQVAQEKPTPDGKSDAPAVEGDKDRNTTSIVSGQKTPPELQPVPPMPQVTQTAQERVEAGRTAQNPLAGYEKIQGDNKEDIGSNIARISPNAEAIPEKIDGTPGPPDRNSSNLVSILVDPQNPLPRPMVDRNSSRPAILKDNKFGTSNVGPVAYNAKWSAYGEYLQMLINAIDARWRDLITASRYYPSSGTEVTVKFVLSSSGEVTAIKSLEGSPNDQATNWCVTAISPGAGFSYGPWTQDMVNMMGSSQELTFSFLYR